MREVSDPAVPPSGADRQADAVGGAPPTAPGTPAGGEAPAAPAPATAPALPPRRVLRDEVLLVLGLSLAASAAYALVDLLSAPIRGVAAPLFANTALIYQLLDLGTSLVPVLLVLHFLGRSRESAASIGLDARQPLSDLGWGLLLAAAVGAVGLGVYVAAVELGVNRSVVPVPPLGHWWTIPVLLLGAARSGLLEEAIVCGYLLRRLNQLGWSSGRALWASALVLGLFFGRVYQRRGRTTPLVIAHFLIDAVAGLGYLALRGKVSWLPR